LGSCVKKGSLVEFDGQRWRVTHHERQASGTFDIIFREVGGAQRTMRADALPTRTFTLILEDQAA